jgi:hypothetical protein
LLSLIQALLTLRSDSLARVMPCFTASSKLCCEVAEISVTRATLMSSSCRLPMQRANVRSPPPFPGAMAGL